MIEPTFSAEELAAAREEGWADGRDTALAEAAERQELALQQAAGRVAEQLAALHRELYAAAEERAEAMARLVLDALAAVFPALCAAHNESESVALVRALLPGLSRLPSVTIRAHPSFADKLSHEIDRLDVAEPGRIQVSAAESIAPGDVRIRWGDGSASRDSGQIWQRVSAVLAAAGLNIPQTEARELDHAA